MKKYLKLNLSESGVKAIGNLKHSIEHRYDASVKSAEICEEHQPIPLVKMVKLGTLNIVGMPDNFSVGDNGMSFYNGDHVDLEQYPELEPLCAVAEDFDYTSINKKDKIIVELEGKFSSIDDKYLYFCNGKILKSQIKSIRIIELPKKEEI